MPVLCTSVSASTASSLRRTVINVPGDLIVATYDPLILDSLI
jgi:hypothetical protein